MDRTASTHLLSSTAARLTRRVFASLPTGIRLAAVYRKLANSIAASFGATVYAAALFYGALGLPVNPDASLERKEGENFKSFVNRATRNSALKKAGATFGTKYYNFCLARFKDEEIVSDFFMTVLTELMDPQATLHIYFKVREFEDIEKSLYTKAKNHLIDLERRKKNRRTDSLPLDEDGKEIDLPSNPSEVGQLDDVLTKDQLQRLEKKLKSKGGLQGEDLSTYFDLLMDGFDPHDIFRWRLLPSMQKDLPSELRLDPSNPQPFGSKKEEISFREELAKYPSPFKNDANAIKTYSRPLMEIIRKFVEQEAN